ncbi:unnamed protein product [Colias eurytheme]|nr:unnamed protein product [Colias eurytheme]
MKNYCETSSSLSPVPCPAPPTSPLSRRRPRRAPRPPPASFCCCSVHYNIDDVITALHPFSTAMELVKARGAGGAAGCGGWKVSAAARTLPHSVSRDCHDHTRPQLRADAAR